MPNKTSSHEIQKVETDDLLVPDMETNIPSRREPENGDHEHVVEHVRFPPSWPCRNRFEWLESWVTCLDWRLGSSIPTTRHSSSTVERPTVRTLPGNWPKRTTRKSEGLKRPFAPFYRMLKLRQEIHLLKSMQQMHDAWMFAQVFTVVYIATNMQVTRQTSYPMTAIRQFPYLGGLSGWDLSAHISRLNPPTVSCSSSPERCSIYPSGLGH